MACHHGASIPQRWSDAARLEPTSGPVVVLRALLMRLPYRSSLGFSAGILLFLSSSNAFAQAAPTGAPPADAKALVEAPKKGPDAPKIEKPLDGTTVSVSAGGVLTTGNSRLLALSGNGLYETRWDNNAVGAAVIGNYGQGATAGKDIQVSAENLQGKLRYDRYLVEEASLFLINTGRHDRFQGLSFRYNLDPGFKYIFVNHTSTSFWGEVGYDLQHDVRREDGRAVLDADKKPTFDANGQPILLDKTQTDHSSRLFAGLKHAFNKEVTFASGVEYLQSFVDSTRYRLNFDALIAANIGAGFAFGFGFSARYDHDPLPGKEKLDTSSTVSLIFAFDSVTPKKADTCPCPEAAPPAPVPADATPAAPQPAPLPPSAMPLDTTPPGATPAPATDSTTTTPAPPAGN
jgi:putative salt-induced outer membrane protein YdiY